MALDRQPTEIDAAARLWATTSRVYPSAQGHRLDFTHGCGRSVSVSSTFQELPADGPASSPIGSVAATNGARDAGEREHAALLRELDNLQRRLATLPVIEQAKGVLMACYGLTGPAAFELLRWRSQHHNVKIRDVAGRLVDAVAQDRLGTRASVHLDRLLDQVIVDLRQQSA